MLARRKAVLVLALATFGGLGVATRERAGMGETVENQQPGSTSPAVKPVGTVKAITGNSIILATDSGSEINVLTQDSTRVVRAAPGQKSLKDATPIQLQDLQVGDRILVRGQASNDAKSLVASAIVVMKRSDIEQKREYERADWQKRGVSGLVNTVDAASGTITISTMAMGAISQLAIHVSKDTVIRRYAADSVRFDDAKLGTIGQVKPGDELRARGTRSADNSQFAAEEIVSGSFRNIAGTLSSIDVAQRTIDVMDLMTKKPALVRVTADSQIRKLPPMLAQRIAMRLKGGAAGGPPNAGSPGSAPRPATGPPSSEVSEGPRAGATPDLQQVLSRLPAATLADLQKGDAVMIVTTQGAVGGAATAITLLSGVEPILASSSSTTQAAFLSSWNLGSSGAEATPQ